MINGNGNTTVEKEQARAADIQLQWLQEDLKKANENRQKNPWIIVAGLQPMYCSDNCKTFCQSEQCFQRHKILRDK